VSSAFTAARGMALAVAMSGMAITQVLVPPLAYWLIATHGWREAYVWLGIGWAAPVLLLTVLFLVDARSIEGRKAAAAEATDEPVAVSGLSVREAIRSAALWRIGISTLITMLLGTAAVVHQVPILVEAGVTRGHAALLASLAGIAAFLGKFVMGWLMDRWHAVRLSGAMLALSGLGFALLLEPFRSPAAILVAMVIIGFAGGAKLQITAYLTSRYGGLLNFGKIFGVMHGLTVLGAGLGPYLAGLVYDTTGSYSAILLLGIPGSLICGALIFGLGPYPGGKQDSPPRAVAAP
jgi:predicted MFS family arabinose efflux permease